MGQMVEKVAMQRGHQVVAKVKAGWRGEEIGAADVCVEFTSPESAMENIRKAAEQQKEIVVGTTGWRIDELREVVDKYDIGLLYGANFSLGIGLVNHFLQEMTKVMNGFEEYDVGGVEMHHAAKKDSPSGTAIEMEKIVKSNMERKQDFQFASVRCGSIPGTHSVFFDSPIDRITLTHEAKSREGFAKGALLAAEWLRGKKGVYTFNEFLEEVMS